MLTREKNSTEFPMTFFMASSSDHLTGVTGISPVVNISKNATAFARASGTISEVGRGWYALAGHVWDRDTLGEFGVNATGVNSDTYDGRYTIVNYDLFRNVPNTGIIQSNIVQINGTTVVATGVVNANITQLNGATVGTTGIINANIQQLNGVAVSGVQEVQSDVVKVSGVPVRLSDFNQNVSLGTGDWVYFADIRFDKDTSNTRDEYAVTWFRNGTVLPSGSISSPTIQVIKVSDGTDLVASANMDFISVNTGTTKYNEPTNTTTAGEPYIVKVAANIDSVARTWQRLISRDS